MSLRGISSFTTSSCARAGPRLSHLTVNDRIPLIPWALVKYFNGTTRCVVIRCSKDFEAILTTTLPLLRSVGKEACRLRVLRVAGEDQSAY